jgi:DNA invertase Pin-like site-specific DNA recombinase
MIEDVQQGSVEYQCILVYDVSRWGRFQDADESAYYEYICKRSGIYVHYCAEQFENDGSPVSTIVKGVKRAMAGEYSRELSSKVFQGACRLIQLGFKQGGPAGFGLRRALINEKGEQKAILSMGEHKSLQTDRVVLVPGPAEEVETVRWMYSAFIREHKSEEEIARMLNERGIVTDFGRTWTRGTVHQVLTNEKYIGNNVYHRTSFKLKRKHVQNPEEKWIRRDRAFEGIVDPAEFSAAQTIILARSQRFSNQELLEKLRALLGKHGRISGIIIDEEEGFPSSTAFRHRFGSLVSAYSLIGYSPAIDYSFIEANRILRKRYPELISEVQAKLQELGVLVTWDPKSELLSINGELRVSVVLCRHCCTRCGSSRWVIRLDESLKPDITIAVRMNAVNDGIRDYYFLPAVDMEWKRLRIAEENGVYLDTYRFDSLEYFFGMAQRTPLQEAA